MGSHRTIGTKMGERSQGFSIESLSIESVIGKTPRILQGKGTDKKVLDRLSAALKTGKKFEGKAINYKKDGTPFIMYWRVIPIKVGRKVEAWLAIQREGSVI